MSPAFIGLPDRAFGTIYRLRTRKRPSPAPQNVLKQIGFLIWDCVRRARFGFCAARNTRPRLSRVNHLTTRMGESDG